MNGLRRVTLAVVLVGALILPTGYPLSLVPGEAASAPQPPASASTLRLYVQDDPWLRSLHPIDAGTLVDSKGSRTIRIGSDELPAPDVILASADGTTLATESFKSGLSDHTKTTDLTIRIFDLQTGAKRAQFHPPVPLIVGALSRDGSQVFGNGLPTTGQQGTEWYALSTFDGSTVSQMRFPTACCYPTNYDPATHSFYVLNVPRLQSQSANPTAPELVMYDLNSGQETGRLTLNGIQAGAGGTSGTTTSAPVMWSWEPGFALSPDGSRIAVLDGTTSKLLLIDAAHLQIVRTETLAQPQGLLQRLGSALGLLPEAALAKEWLGVSVDMQFSPDGRRLFVTGQTGSIDQNGKWMLGGLGLRVVDVASGRILAETYANRSVRPIVAPDGSAVYTITPKSDTAAWPYILSRHDPLTLQVTAQREVDDGAALYFLVPPALGAAGCQPASPSEPWGSPAGAPEVRGTARKGQLWALVFHSLPIVAKQQVKIVWRMSGQGALHIFAEQGKGARLVPDWGPQQHGGSNWNRPGDEWGTGFTFPQPGCWRVHASRSHIAGDVWFQVAR